MKTIDDIPLLNPDFNSLDFIDNPYAFYRLCHDEYPVFKTNENIVYLTRYQDCQNLLSSKFTKRKSPDGFSPIGGDPASSLFNRMLGEWMVFDDPPRHSQTRKIFQHPFLISRVNQLATDITEIASTCFDSFQQEDQIDFVEKMAYPIPITVISKILGVPTEDYELFRGAVSLITEALDTGDSESVEKANEAVIELVQYFGTLMLKKNASPTDDFISALVKDKNIFEKINKDTLIFGFIFLLWAGHETTKALLANGLNLILKNEQQDNILSDKPAMLEAMIEEILRFDSPIQKLSRWTNKTCEFGGFLISPHTQVVALIGAANRDPEVFQEPDIFNVGRDIKKHLSFGRGIHMCLGAGLARLEAKIIFPLLFLKFRNIQLLELQWRTLSAFRTPEHLLIQL